MSQDIVNCLIAIAVDLVVLVTIYSAASYLIARATWHRGGTFSLVLLVVLSQLFWIPLAILTARPSEFTGTASYSAWFANWLVTGFALVLLQRRTQSIPKSLEDAAQLDGLGAIGTWRQAVLPYVKRDLALVAIFLMMALLMSGWRFLFAGPDGLPSLVVFYRIVASEQYFALITIGSLIGAIPLIAIFFVAKRRQ